MTNKSEPAFPSTMEYFPGDKNCTENCGLTKREYFAAMAMQGLISRRPTCPTWPSASLIACDSIEIADALIEELNK